MTTHLHKVLVFLFIVISQHSYSQNEFFHEVILEKKLIENEKLELVGEANFKHIYNEPAWRRWGVSFAAVRKIKRFSLSFGTNGFYTFNRSITNFFEVRPWTALQLKIPIFADVSVRQRLQYEWRFFYTEDKNSTEDNYMRIRYQIGLDIPIQGSKDSSWTIRPLFEWFFIRRPAIFERFPNQRAYEIMVIKSLRKNHKLLFSYKVEEYYDTHTERILGQTLLIGYSL